MPAKKMNAATVAFELEALLGPYKGELPPAAYAKVKTVLGEYLPAASLKKFEAALTGEAGGITAMKIATLLGHPEHQNAFLPRGDDQARNVFGQLYEAVTGTSALPADESIAAQRSLDSGGKKGGKGMAAAIPSQESVTGTADPEIAEVLQEQQERGMRQLPGGGGRAVPLGDSGGREYTVGAGRPAQWFEDFKRKGRGGRELEDLLSRAKLKDPAAVQRLWGSAFGDAAEALAEKHPEKAAKYLQIQQRIMEEGSLDAGLILHNKVQVMPADVRPFLKKRLQAGDPGIELTGPSPRTTAAEATAQVDRVLESLDLNDLKAKPTGGSAGTAAAAGAAKATPMSTATKSYKPVGKYAPQWMKNVEMGLGEDAMAGASASAGNPLMAEAGKDLLTGLRGKFFNPVEGPGMAGTGQKLLGLLMGLNPVSRAEGMGALGALKSAKGLTGEAGMLGPMARLARTPMGIGLIGMLLYQLLSSGGAAAQESREWDRVDQAMPTPEDLLDQMRARQIQEENMLKQQALGGGGGSLPQQALMQLLQSQGGGLPGTQRFGGGM